LFGRERCSRWEERRVCCSLEACLSGPGETSEVEGEECRGGSFVGTLVDGRDLSCPAIRILVVVVGGGCPDELVVRGAVDVPDEAVVPVEVAVPEKRPLGAGEDGPKVLGLLIAGSVPFGGCRPVSTPH